MIIIFNYYHVVHHFRWQPLSKITKVATMTLSFKIETCNRIRTPLSLDQSSTWAYFWSSCWSSWMLTLSKITKMGTMNNSTIQDSDLHWKPVIGWIFNLNILSAILLASWVEAITKTLKKCYYCSIIQDRDIQQEPKTAKFESIFN